MLPHRPAVHAPPACRQDQTHPGAAGVLCARRRSVARSSARTSRSDSPCSSANQSSIAVCKLRTTLSHCLHTSPRPCLHQRRVQQGRALGLALQRRHRAGAQAGEAAAGGGTRPSCRAASSPRVSTSHVWQITCQTHRCAQNKTREELIAHVPKLMLPVTI